METSATIKEISKAILAAQKTMGTAHKDSSNPYFKSKYADLNAIREACMPALNSNGITVLQPTVCIDGRNFVQTILLHESGEFISGLTEIVYSKDRDAQAQGSGITYARRYGLQSLMNVGAEDDDGNKASQPGNVVNTPASVTAAKPNGKKPLEPDTTAYTKAVDFIATGGTWSQVEKTYYVSPEIKEAINKEAKVSI